MNKSTNTKGYGGKHFIISAILSISILFSLAPYSAFAATTSNESSSKVTNSQESRTYVVTGSYSLPYYKGAVYSSSNKKIAKISKKGKVTLKNLGVVNLTIKTKDKNIVYRVTVVPPDESYLSFVGAYDKADEATGIASGVMFPGQEVNLKITTKKVLKSDGTVAKKINMSRANWHLETPSNSIVKVDGHKVTVPDVSFTGAYNYGKGQFISIVYGDFEAEREIYIVNPMLVLKSILLGPDWDVLFESDNICIDMYHKITTCDIGFLKKNGVTISVDGIPLSSNEILLSSAGEHTLSYECGSCYKTVKFYAEYPSLEDFKEFADTNVKVTIGQAYRMTWGDVGNLRSRGVTIALDGVPLTTNYILVSTAGNHTLSYECGSYYTSMTITTEYPSLNKFKEFASQSISAVVGNTYTMPWCDIDELKKAGVTILYDGVPLDTNDIYIGTVGEHTITYKCGEYSLNKVFNAEYPYLSSFKQITGYGIRAVVNEPYELYGIDVQSLNSIGVKILVDGIQLASNTINISTPGTHTITYEYGTFSESAQFTAKYSFNEALRKWDLRGYENEYSNPVKYQVLQKVIEVCDDLLYKGMSERERVQKIHDYIIYNANYYNNGNVDANAPAYLWSAEGIFFHGEAVCAGYSEAFGLMAIASGLDCVIITGDNHGWNRVKVDGVWYYIDCTWDDPIFNGKSGGFENQRYFLSESLWGDHTAESQYSVEYYFS